MNCLNYMHLKLKPLQLKILTFQNKPSDITVVILQNNNITIVILMSIVYYKYLKEGVKMAKLLIMSVVSFCFIFLLLVFLGTY